MAKNTKNLITYLISPELLEELACEPSYSRGVQYAEDGRVTNVRLEDDCIHAKVHGTHLYRVELWEEDGELCYSCTCPFCQDEMVFCKHCVAAGLAFLEAEGERKGARGGTKSPPERDMSMADVKAHLEKQDEASLVSLLLQQADDDERFKSRLMMKAGKGSKMVHLPAFRKMIDRAVDWGGFVDHRSMYEYSQGIEDVIGSLREFLANEYHTRNRHDDAMKLIWAEFAEHSGFEECKLLKSHAERSGGSRVWKTWRDKALRLVKESILAAEREAEKKHWKWNAVDRSLLVQIFLWEKNVDQAWLEAQEGGCHESLWLELAAKRERDHPEDALAVYRSLVEPAIMRMNNDAYRVAVGYVKKAGKLLKQLGRGDEWSEYLTNLRANHRRKRNFIALLDKMGG